MAFQYRREFKTPGDIFFILYRSKKSNPKKEMPVCAWCCEGFGVARSYGTWYQACGGWVHTVTGFLGWRDKACVRRNPLTKKLRCLGCLRKKGEL